MTRGMEIEARKERKTLRKAHLAAQTQSAIESQLNIETAVVSLTHFIDIGEASAALHLWKQFRKITPSSETPSPRLFGEANLSSKELNCTAVNTVSPNNECCSFVYFSNLSCCVLAPLLTGSAIDLSLSSDECNPLSSGRIL